MIADLTAFASLVFAYYFYWAIHPDFPPPAPHDPGQFWPLLAAGIALGAWVAMLLARSRNSAGSTAGLRLWLVTATALAVAGANPESILAVAEGLRLIADA